MPHIHEKIDFTVEVFLVYNNKVLLRKHDKYGIWLSVGGHIELEEDPNEAALREVKEEVGLKIGELVGNKTPQLKGSKDYKELIPPRFFNRHRISPQHEHVTSIYFARATSDKVKPSGGDRSDEWRWFSSEELDSNKYEIRENIKYYAKKALEELS